MAALSERRTGLAPWHPASLIATWFGAGLLPWAPGTWGSLAALPFAWAIAAVFGVGGLLVAAALAFLLGWWAAERVGRASGVEDQGAIVIDEVAGQWLAVAVAPLDPIAYLLGFLLFRLFDITKPWPASWADRSLPGGLGVMTDDVVAGLYAAAALYLLLTVGGPLLGR
jgi:phosphatidylglycerophosphatase A